MGNSIFDLSGDVEKVLTEVVSLKETVKKNSDAIEALQAQLAQVSINPETAAKLHAEAESFSPTPVTPA